MRTVTLPATLNSSSNDGCDRVDFSVQAPQDGSDLWLMTRNQASAFKLVVKGILLDTFGQFPPQTFIPIGRYLVFRIPSQLMDAGKPISVTVLLYSDHHRLSLGPIYAIDQKTAHFYNDILNLIDTDIYRYFSFLCFFIFVYFLVQFVQAPRELSNLYFALFNLCVALYFFGTGFVWTGLPFSFFYGFFKACLFPGISFLLLFCMAFSAIGNRAGKIVVLGTGFLLFVYVISFSQDSASAYDRFRHALVGGSLMMIAAYIFILRQYLKGQRELRPLILGGIFGLITGLVDIWSLLTGTATLFWLQGFGIFVFLLSVFMALAQRTSRMHRDLAGYARTIELEVSRRTTDLNTSNLALHRASKAKSAFLAHMSHEIRTPLNGIMGFSQLIQQGTTDESTRYYSGLILRESDHLMQLISQVLDFSRIEQGKLLLEQRPFNPLETISTVMESFAYAARQKGLQFEFLVSGDIPDPANGDQMRFQQILVNILGNAIKFTERGFVRIEAGGDRIPASNKTRVNISISDSGIGIPADKIENIFQGFEQADASISRKYGGTGLGISIARDLVRLMGGEIFVTSSFGKGTTVTYHVFLENAEETRNGDQSGDLLETPRIGDFSHDFTVLIVDDYPSNIDVLKAFLGKAGVACREASSGAEALHIMAQPENGIDLILMDIHMPGMDGFETTRLLRRYEHNRAIPIVAVTADAYEDVRAQCRELGIAGVLTKPLRYDTFLACLQEFAPDVRVESQKVPKKSGSRNEKGAVSAAIDLQLLMETYFDDEETVYELLASFVMSAGPIMGELEIAVESMDFAAISLKSHAIKGAALNIAAPRVANSASMLQEKALEHRHDKIAETLQLLKQEWSAFLDEYKTLSTKAKK